MSGDEDPDQLGEMYGPSRAPRYVMMALFGAVALIALGLLGT